MEANVDEILGRYPLASGQCSPCAREVYALFIKEGHPAQIGHIETDLPRYDSSHFRYALSKIMDAIDVLYGRSGMYLAPFEKKVDAASFFLNCLIAVFDSDEFGSPYSVCLTVMGQNFHMQAVGVNLDQLLTAAHDLASVFDIENYKTPFFDNSYALGFLRPVVWFAEYCMVEMTAGSHTSRQSFLYGEPLGEKSTFARNGSKSSLDVHFTLPVKPFVDVTLPSERLERAVNAWEKREFLSPLPGEVSRPVLHKEWCIHSADHYSFQMIPARTGIYAEKSDI